jgi:myosin heavy subunit
VYGYQAGKTFQTKQILRFLAYVAGGAGDDYADQLLSTTPILEG